MKKLLPLVLVALLVQGCASTGSVKKAGYVGLSVAGQALFLIQNTEMGLVCDRPGAPPAPACVSEALHTTEISPRLAKAFAIGERASGTLRALPPTISGATPEVIAFVKQIWDLVGELMTLLPQSDPAKKLAAKVDALAAKK